MDTNRDKETCIASAARSTASWRQPSSEDERDPTAVRNKQHVLDACEDAIRRLACDRRYFARPARSLFNEVRMHFAIGDQLRVWTVIDRNIGLALEFLERTARGRRPRRPAAQCRAHTRKGTPCQREPLPGRDYCPSHKHLEETFDGAEITVERSSVQRGRGGRLKRSTARGEWVARVRGADAPARGGPGPDDRGL